MMITKEKKVNISINLDNEERATLAQLYRTIDLIDDEIQGSCEGDITDFMKEYYGSILAFIHELYGDTELFSTNISNYINSHNE